MVMVKATQKMKIKTMARRLRKMADDICWKMLREYFVVENIKDRRWSDMMTEDD